MSLSPPLSPPTAIPTASIHPLSLSPPKNKPWTHEETLNLIRAYQEKWYSLKRGQLKASQWEEVAVAVAAFCGLDEPSKSATQCRHKIEKLRKRYRAEKQKPYPNSWIYFNLMNQLERGPLPISAVAPPPESDDSGSEEDDGVGDFRSGHARGGRELGEFEKRVDGLLLAGRKMGEFGSGYRRMSDFEGGNLGRKRKSYEDEEDEEAGRELEECSNSDGNGNLVVGELAAQMREFAERFVRIERKKMEVMRENERFRMEMENKRMQMILVSQQKTVDMISKVFASAQTKTKTT